MLSLPFTDMGFLKEMKLIGRERPSSLRRFVFPTIA